MDIRIKVDFNLSTISALGFAGPDMNEVSQQRRHPPGAWGHPRVCGEKLRSWHTQARALGSPPRMRGKGDPAKHRTRQAGITPAYAGKSLGRLKGPLF